MHPLVLPSTFSASAEPSVNFRLYFLGLLDHLKKVRADVALSVQSRDLPLAFHACMGPSSTFRMSVGHSMNYRQLSVLQGDLP